MTDTELRERVDELYAQLAATEELPIATGANRWLGEAQAVVGDVAGADVPDEVVVTRVARAHELLEHVEETGDEEADERVAAAAALAASIADRD